ncbi:hypothetical protein DL93DRAFT_2090126, partial [Clavulina sp. PMI_390]
MGTALLAGGAGLVGGALLMDAFEDHEDHEEREAYDQGYQDGQDSKSSRCFDIWRLCRHELVSDIAIYSFLLP